MAPPLTLSRADRERLRVGAAELGQALDAAALDRFAAYARLLERWYDSTSLISCRSATELVDRHFLDSLACAWPCGAARDIADLGSGAGLPGIPLAIIDPERRVVLVESRRRRASFLREARRELHLSAVEVCERRVEEAILGAELSPVEVATARAVWGADDAATSMAGRWIRPGGVLLLMRTDSQRRSAGTGVPRAEQSFTYMLRSGSRRRIDVFRRGGGAECFT